MACGVDHLRPLGGAAWTERRAAEAVKERDAAAAAIDAEVSAGVVPPPPIQTQIQRMGGMSSPVIGGFCEHASPVVHGLVAKFADMTAKETAKEHGWQLKEATAYQRGAPHTTAAGHRDMARLPRKQNRAPALRAYVGPTRWALIRPSDPSTEYARTLRHLQASDARWRAEKNRAQSHILGTQGVGGSRLSRGPHALWRRPAPAPAAQATGDIFYILRRQITTSTSKLMPESHLVPP
jgi:hypothetical protein